MRREPAPLRRPWPAALPVCALLLVGVSGSLNLLGLGTTMSRSPATSLGFPAAFYWQCEGSAPPVGDQVVVLPPVGDAAALAADLAFWYVVSLLLVRRQRSSTAPAPS